MIFSILFSVLLFGQSYSDKPVVPVFKVNGENFVRVDCWDYENEMRSHYLPQTKHPKIFNVDFESTLYSKMKLEVSLLNAESTLKMTQFEGDEEVFEVETYGTECGFKTYNHSLYCSVFDGEIFENVLLNSTRRL